MLNDLLENICISEMLNVIDADKGGVWHIYTKEIDDNRVIVTFCKYVYGLSTIQSQAVISYLDWEDNKINFEKYAYISEI